MPTVADLTQLQIATETTWGTPVTPMTKRLQGVSDFSIDPGVETENFRHRRGSMVHTFDVDFKQMKPMAKASIDVSYEDINYWLESMVGVVTPTGAGPYVRAGTAPVNASPANPRGMTMTYGAPGFLYQMNGGLVKAITIKGDTTSKITADVDLIGSRVIAGGTHAVLTDLAQNYVMGLDISLFIDSFGGTIGTTAVANSAMSFSLNVDTNRDQKHYFGNNYPAYYKDPAWTGKLDLHVELNATTKAYLDAMIGLTTLPSHQIRLRATRGTNILQFDFAGSIGSAPEIYQVDDDILALDITWTQRYSSALTNWFRYSSTNSVATLA